MTHTERIRHLKAEWGRRLFILGHYYQKDEVLQHADAVGDSLELSRRAAAERTAEKIVFCGVHFMAESADLLAAPHQTVYLPDIEAICPMAEMAAEPEVRQAWACLQQHGADWLPVVYVNSQAAIKAFCGEQGGCTCTSSSAEKAFRWVLDQGRRVFFLPDEHLGANTAVALGLPDERVAVYDPARPQGGLDAAALARAQVVVWKGYCHVHTDFQSVHIRWVRETYPEAKIIVHPETPRPVAQQADARGSTAQIVKYVEALPAGSTVFIGTEVHLIDRLARHYQGRLTVKPLLRSACPNMGRINEPNLLRTLETWPAGGIVRVAERYRAPARRALARMLAL